MNAVIEDANKNVTELRAPGPGERLRSARLSAGLEIAKVAAQLHLNDAMVHALERDDYHAMPGRVFIRGYLRNYARLVAVPAESVIKQFDEQLPKELQDRQLNRIGTSVRSEVRSGYSAVKLVSWLVLFAVFGAFFAWWKGYLSWRGQSPLAVMEEQAAALTSLSTPGADGQLTLPSRPTRAATPTATNRTDGPTAGQEAPNARLSTSPGTPTAGGPALDSSGDLLPLPPAAAGRPIKPVVATLQRQPELAMRQPPPKETVALPIPPVGRPGIILQFEGPCWVDVRDAKRKFKLFGEMPKGTRKVLGGTPPYDVVLGNASVVRVSINGVPYDIARHARGNVARFVLDPASM